MKKALVSLTCLVILGSCALLSSSPEAQLARCLKDKDIKMYGTTWCPHCIRQKQTFGKAWKDVPFIDCQANRAECSRAEVKEYPTWFFPEGRIMRKGYLRLDMLANFAGCPFSMEKVDKEKDLQN